MGVKARKFTRIDEDASYSELIENRGVLERAKEIVDGRDKQQHYGPPEESMSAIGYAFTAAIFPKLKAGEVITAGDAARMMAGLKIARLGFDPEHADSLDDLAGYARIFERVK